MYQVTLFFCINRVRTFLYRETKIYSKSCSPYSYYSWRDWLISDWTRGCRYTCCFSWYGVVSLWESENGFRNPWKTYEKRIYRCILWGILVDYFDNINTIPVWNWFSAFLHDSFDWPLDSFLGVPCLLSKQNLRIQLSSVPVLLIPVRVIFSVKYSLMDNTSVNRAERVSRINEARSIIFL